MAELLRPKYAEVDGLGKPRGSSAFGTTGRTETILVLDDNPRLVKLIVRNFEIAQYRVVGFTDGQRLLEYLDRTEPDLVVLDALVAGKVAAKDVVRRIRDVSTVPVLMLTAKGLGKNSERRQLDVLEAGADASLDKPVQCTRIARDSESASASGANAGQAVIDCANSRSRTTVWP
jgi:DNA-binding response OmpR family regulator